jgi:hypothetical protein
MMDPGMVNMALSGIHESNVQSAASRLQHGMILQLTGPQPVTTTEKVWTPFEILIAYLKERMNIRLRR